jgi:hypothetical protein
MLSMLQYNRTILQRICELSKFRYYPSILSPSVLIILNELRNPILRVNTLMYFTNQFNNDVFPNVIVDFLKQQNVDTESLLVDIYTDVYNNLLDNNLVDNNIILDRFRSVLWDYCHHLPILRQKIELDGYQGDYIRMFKIQYQTNNEYSWNVIDRVPRDYVIDFFLFNHDLESLQRFLTKEEITEELFERAILFPTNVKKEYQQSAYWIGKQIQFTKIANYNFLFLLALTIEDIPMAGKLYAKHKFELTKDILGVMGKHGSKDGFRFVFKKLRNVDKNIYISFTANQACIRNNDEFVKWLFDYYPEYQIYISDLAINKMIELRYFECLKVVKNFIGKHHHNKICECGNEDFLIWYFNNFNIKEKPFNIYSGYIWQKMKDENTKKYYQKMFKTMWDQKLPIAEWIIKPLVMEYLIRK